MKKTDALIKITSLLVFIALAAYLTVYIVHRASNPVRTALTVTASMSESAPMSGLVIRNELLINSKEQYIDVTAADGSKVAAGQEVAVAYSSEEALERASRLRLLDREIADVTASLNGTGATQAAGSREQSIYSALMGLSGCLRGGDLTEVDTRSGTAAPPPPRNTCSSCRRNTTSCGAPAPATPRSSPSARAAPSPQWWTAMRAWTPPMPRT